MKVELDHNGLVTLVRGCVPSYDQMEHWSVKGRGHFTDNNGWFWNTEILSKLSDNELYDLYVFISKVEAKAEKEIRLPKVFKLSDINGDTEFIEGDSIEYNYFEDSKINKISEFLSDKARKIGCYILEVKSSYDSLKLVFTAID